MDLETPPSDLNLERAITKPNIKNDKTTGMRVYRKQIELLIWLDQK